MPHTPINTPINYRMIRQPAIRVLGITKTDVRPLLKVPTVGRSRLLEGTNVWPHLTPNPNPKMRYVMIGG